MSSQSTVLKFYPMVTYLGGSITSSYTQMGTPYEYGILGYKIYNDTSQYITISLDGSTDHDYISPNHHAYYLYLASANLKNSPLIQLPENTTFWVKCTGAAVGNVYVTAFYAYDAPLTLPGL